MSISAIESSASRSVGGKPAVGRHQVRIWTAAFILALVIASVGVYGLDYYGLSLSERALNPKHALLRPSGTVGLRLGIFGVFLFACLYMYPLRKKWRWLGQFGQSRNWLDFHVLFGIAAPAAITLHSSFKFQGLAGVAYWLMIAVMASGVVGRYLYAKIPRRLNSAEISLAELKETVDELTRALQMQESLSPDDIAAAFRLPSVDEVKRLSLPKILLLVLWVDLMGVFHTSRLRRSRMGAWSVVTTLGGLLRSGNRSLERAVTVARQRGRIQTRIVFLGRMNQIFHLWHVVHRPFSYAFATFAIFHIVFMVMLGYY